MTPTPIPLENARVLVVGAGGLGCPAAIALARAGVGTLGIADDDVVDSTNLHRQILFGDADVGEPKAQAAATRLLELVPSVRIEVHRARLLPSNAEELVRGYDLVVEGSDNFATKFLTADACALVERPVVHAAAVRWHGTALAVGAHGGPCYRCLFEDVPLEDAPNCAEAGVMGPVVGIIASGQADLALSLLEADESVIGELFTLEGKSMTARRRRVSKRSTCPLCGDSKRIGHIEPKRYAIGLEEEREAWIPS